MASLCVDPHVGANLSVEPHVGELVRGAPTGGRACPWGAHVGASLSVDPHVGRTCPWPPRRVRQRALVVRRRGACASRCVAGERGEGGLDAVLLEDAGHLEVVGEADPQEVAAGEELGRRVELVEQLLGDAADQVLAGVGDLDLAVGCGSFPWPSWCPVVCERRFARGRSERGFRERNDGRDGGS